MVLRPGSITTSTTLRPLMELFLVPWLLSMTLIVTLIRIRSVSNLPTGSRTPELITLLP